VTDVWVTGLLNSLYRKWRQDYWKKSYYNWIRSWMHANNSY